MKNRKKGTATARVYRDVATMLAGILSHDPAANTAAILDPLIRPELERRYAALPSHVRQTVEARAKKANAAKLAKARAG